MTRKEYIETRGDDGMRQAAHRAYYAQFVTPYVKAQVAQAFGVDALKNSTDRHFNDIPLGRWDTQARNMRSWIAPLVAEQDAGGCSLSDLVCTLKEAARQIVEESKTEAISA